MKLSWRTLVALTAALSFTTAVHAMLDPAAGRFMQRDPLGYVDGPNVYTLFAVHANGLDPSGLSPTLITFSGINSAHGADGQTRDYVYDYMRDNPQTSLDAHVLWGGAFVSDAGSEARFLRNPGQNVLTVPLPGWSELVLAADADANANGGFQSLPSERGRTPTGHNPAACGGMLHISVVMVAPRIAGRSPFSRNTSRCAIDSTVYWNPHDRVPNGGLIGNVYNSKGYWQRFGTLYMVSPRADRRAHNLPAFLNGDNIPQKRVVERRRRRRFGPRSRGFRYYTRISYVDDPNGYNGGNPVSRINRLAQGSDDFVFVCHSQGCNIMNEFLKRNCRDGR